MTTPTKTYSTAGAFRRALEERLKRTSQTDRIDLNRLRRQVSFDRLLSRLFREESAPWALKGGNAGDFARVLVLDKWAANSDGRQAVFSKRVKARKYTATFIDQGYCFNAGEWSFPDLALHGVYYRNFVYAGVTGWDAFEPTLTKAEEADVIDLWRCADPIPPEWYDYDGQALEELIETLHERRHKIRSLIEAFRDSSRSPFPNWKETSTKVFLPIYHRSPDAAM